MIVRSLVRLGLVMVVVLLPGGPARANGGPPEGGVVRWNEDYILERDALLDGDLVVFGGSATLETGSVVEGTVVVWGGDAEIDGTVAREVVVSSGDVFLGANAVIQGAVVCSWGCDIEREEGSQVHGDTIEDMPSFSLGPEYWLNQQWTSLDEPSHRTPWVSGVTRVLGVAVRAARSIAGVLVVAIVAGLVALLWPGPTNRVSRTASKAPWPSIGVGLLTAFAATALVVALAVTVCLSPVALLAALAVSAGGLFGWIAIGALVGERLLEALKARQITPLWAASLGTLLITVVSSGLRLVRCVGVFGWMLMLALGCLGLGAVVLTRFGTTQYTPDELEVVPPSAAPARRLADTDEAGTETTESEVESSG